VHLAVQQCQGSKGDWIGFIGAPMTWISANYILPQCVQFVTATRRAADYMQAINYLFFQTPLRSRLQLSFAWMLWTDPRVDNMMFDVERSHVYTWPKSTDMFGQNFPLNWDLAYGLCGQLGAGWYHTVVTANHENSIVVTYGNNTQIPVGHVRNKTGQFVWINGENATWFNWYSDMSVKYPGVTALYDCAHIDFNYASTWLDVNCRPTTPIYSVTTCEMDSWYYSGSVSFTADPSTVQKNFTVFGPVQSTQTPSDSNILMFGATIQMHALDCKQLDRFLFGTGHDKIYVAYDQDCMIQLAGDQTVQQYNIIVLSAQFTAVDTTRATLTFGFVYWMSYYVRDMFINTYNSHVYTSYGRTM